MNADLLDVDLGKEVSLEFTRRWAKRRIPHLTHAAFQLNKVFVSRLKYQQQKILVGHLRWSRLHERAGSLRLRYFQVESTGVLPRADK